MQKFKVGDRVKRKDGDCFSNGMFDMTVGEWPNSYKGISESWKKKYVWLKETHTYTNSVYLELIDTLQPWHHYIKPDATILVRSIYNEDRTNWYICKVVVVTQKSVVVEHKGVEYIKPLDAAHFKEADVLNYLKDKFGIEADHVLQCMDEEGLINKDAVIKLMEKEFQGG